MFRSRRRAYKAAKILCIISIVTFSVGDFARADLVWDGSTDSTWSNFSNWTPTAGETAAPVAGDTAVFSGAGNGNTTIDLSTAATVDAITFDTASAAAYTIGAGAVGTDTLTFADNGATPNLSLRFNVVNDQTINANILLGPDAAVGDYNFDLDSTTKKLIINGNIDTAAGGTAGVKRLEFGDFNNADIGTVDVNGNISNTGAATRIDLFAAGANINLNGAVAADGGNTMRTIILNNGSITVGSAGVLGRGQLDIRQGTVTLNNTTTTQVFENTINLGSITQAGTGNATLNITAGATATMQNAINYFASTGNNNTALISGGTLQITGSNEAIIVNNNTNATGTGAFDLSNSDNPELTITSTITSDGLGANGDRDLTIRNTGGGTLLLAPSGTANSFGGVTMQEGFLLLGSGALSSEGDFLAVTARNNAATANSTEATVDLRGTTHALGNGTGTAGVGGTLTFGATNTASIVDNNFQANVVDTVGGGKLTNVNNILYNKGTGTGIQRNGAATLSADIDFDTSGASKAITIQDGRAATDLTISSAFNTTGLATDDYEFIGDGTLQISGTLGFNGTVNGHDRTFLRNQKTILGAGADLSGAANFHVEQRNSATFSDFEVELDLNGQELVLEDTLITSAFSTNLVAALNSTRITDSAGGGRVTMTGNTDGNRNIVYNTGSATFENKTAFISADLRAVGGGISFNVNNGADVIDLDVSGTLTSDNGTRQLNKNNAGTLRLSATDNTAGYGVLQITNGTVVITNPGALGSDDIGLGNDTTSGVLEYNPIGGNNSNETITNQIRLGDNTAGVARVGDGDIVNNNSGTGGLTFSNANFNQARGAVTVARTLGLGGTNTGINTITGAIVDNNTGGGGTVAVTKSGSNTWTLNGNNTYTGATTVSAGQLNIGGTNASSITVASGANLGGEGSTSGNLVFQGATHTLDINALSTAALGSTGTGSLDVSALNVGGFTINVNGTGAGAVDVLTFGSGGFIGALDKFVIGSAPAASARTGGSGTLALSATAVTFDLGFEDKIWQGTDGTNPTFWDEGASSTANWSGGSDALFFNGDSVTFGDTATNFNPTLQSNVTAGNVTFSGTDTTKDFTLDGGGNTLTVNGTLTVANGDATTTNDGNDLTINAIIAGTGSLYVGDQDGSRDASQNSVTLSGANTYSGGTTIDEGRVSITNSSALGTGAVTIDESSGVGTANRDPFLDLDANTLNIANDITIGNTGTKIIRLDNGGVTANTGELSGSITNLEVSDTGFRLEVGRNDTLTVSGKYSGVGGLFARATTQTEQGTVELTNAANDFTGNLVVASNVEVASIGNVGVASHAGAGSLIVLGASASATPANNNNQDGNLIYTGGGESSDKQFQVGNFWFTAGHNSTNGGAITNNGTGALIFTNGAFNLSESRVAADIGARTLTLGGSYNGVNEIQGSILNNSATDGFVDESVAVNVAGSTWAFSGVNSGYSGGTTVMSGATLLVNNATGSGTGTGTVTVDAGGTLGGTGIIAGATTISGTHGPGQSPGVQTFGGDLTYNAGSNIAWELVSNTDDTSGARGTDFDGIDVAGNLVFNATTTLDFDFSGAVNFTDNFWTDPGGVSRDWTIFEGASSVTGIANLAFNGNGQTAPGSFSISLNGTDVVLNYTLTAVPEGSTFMMFCMAFGLFGFGRRRKAIATA